MASLIRPACASVRNPSAPRPVAMNTCPVPGRWFLSGTSSTTTPRFFAGDPAKNLGVVVLLVPLKNHRPGTGQVFIATGRGAEGFLTDAQAGRIRDAMVPYLAREDYGAGLTLGVELIAQAFAREFGFTLTGEPPPPPDETDRLPIPAGLVIAVVVLLIIVTRGRILWWALVFSRFSGGGRGWSGGGGGWEGGGELR